MRHKKGFMSFRARPHFRPALLLLDRVEGCRGENRSPARVGLRDYNSPILRAVKPSSSFPLETSNLSGKPNTQDMPSVALSCKYWAFVS